MIQLREAPLSPRQEHELSAGTYNGVSMVRGTLEHIHQVRSAGQSRGSLALRIRGINGETFNFDLPVEFAEEPMMPGIIPLLQGERVYCESAPCTIERHGTERIGSRYKTLRMESGMFKGTAMTRYSNL